MTSKTLDLGCGTNPRNPYNTDTIYGIDIRSSPDNPNIKVADLAVEEIPFESDYFDAVSAFDFIEHIPRVIYMPERRFPFIILMNEIYRVLKKGCYFIQERRFIHIRNYSAIRLMSISSPMTHLRITLMSAVMPKCMDSMELSK